MKLCSYFLVILFFISMDLYSQQGWEIQTGGVNLSSPANFSAIQYINSTVWVVRNSDIIKSTNEGATWTTYSNSLGYIGIKSMQFINESTGWAAAVSGNSRILRSTDGGISWMQIDTVSYSINSIYFTNEQNGWAATGSGTVLHTTNGGLNWISSPSGVIESLNSIKFTDQQNGWACGNWGSIVRTSNGGINWIVQKSNTVSFLSSISFINSSTGFICGTGGRMIKTTNGGNSWFVSQTGISENLLSVNILASGFGIATGLNGVYVRTSNSGLSWVSGNLSGSSSVFYTAFSSSGIGFGIYDTGIIMSTDYGASWINVFSRNLTSLSFKSVDFVNQTGWVVGENCSLFRTVNSGYNWQQINIPVIRPTGKFFRAVNFINESTGWICGDSGFVFKSTNGGLNWSQQDPGIMQNFYGITFIDGLNGFACGNLRILKTTNGGSSWDSSFATGTMNAIQFVNNSVVWCVGLNGRLYKSLNSGLSWSGLPNPIPGAGYYSLSFIDESTGYVGGLQGKVIKTTNGGASWSVQQLPSGNIVTGTYFENTLKGWCCLSSSTNPISSAGAVYFTSNGGENWTRQDTQTVGLNAITFTSQGIGWAVGSYGTVIHTINGGVFVNNNTTSIPSNFKLYQNYPNPFNPSTTIDFNLSKTAFVNLSVYNILGMKISELVNRKLSEGSFSFQWNSNDLPSGIYFYKLSSDNFSETKKMILLK